MTLINLILRGIRHMPAKAPPMSMRRSCDTVATIWEWLNGALFPTTVCKPHTNGTSSLRIRPADTEIRPDPAHARRAGRTGQRLLRTIYRGLHAQGDAPSAEAINGAEIASAAGTKSPFHDQLSGALVRIAASHSNVLQRAVWGSASPMGVEAGGIIQ